MRQIGAKSFALLLLALGQVSAADLRPETVKAWENYIGSVRARTEARLGGKACFLWSDEDGDRLLRLRRGEILVSAADGQTPMRVPGGLIHHWIGAMYMPGATLPEAISTLRNYGRYKEFYPSVVGSRLMSRNGDIDKFTTLERRQAMFSRIALDADFSASYTEAGEKRGYSVSNTTRLQQIQNYGDRRQYEMEPGAPKAYLWRLSSITRYEERDGGVYLELEAIGLSRDIPASLHWLVDPFVRQVATTAMVNSMRQTRQAIVGDRISVGRVPSGAAGFLGR